MIPDQSATSDEARASDVLSVVADERRRAILHSLEQVDGEALDVESLVDRVADRIERSGPDGQGHRERVHATLHHNHLPKLAEAGLVSYDPRSGRVRRIDDEFAAELLDTIETVE